MFEVGDVLAVTWDSRPIRVIAVDPIEVFYDVHWSEDVGWGLVRARTAIYYRIATDFLLTTAKKLRSEPLSQKEVAKHRPDLPMRLLQSETLNWSDDLKNMSMLAQEVNLDISHLAIIPFGAKGGGLKAEKIQSGNGEFFTGSELLAQAHSSQEATCSAVVGVGLYRSGISGGIPSYYIWGAVDQAGNSV